MQQSSDNRRLWIGALAAALDLNPKTVRYYEDIGLLPRPDRSESSYRLYDIADLERLQFILKAKAIGLSLSEIRGILDLRSAGEQPCEHVLELVDQKLAKVDEQLRRFTEFRDELISLRQEAAENIRPDACTCGIIEFHKFERYSRGAAARE